MKRALLFFLLAAAPVCAQENPSTPAEPTPPTLPAPPTTPAPPVVITVPAPTASTPAFLLERGVVSSQELIDSLNAKLTPQQRVQFDQALAKRNAALTKANDEFSATLRDLLRETDEGLAKRIDEGDEAKRMERMKRLQPGRYQHLMQQKKKQEEKAAKEKQKTQ